MKLKINKACDLNSISVLPPHSRRSNIMQQVRSQASQQSFSQPVSSQQNGMFSQISQSSIDDVGTDNQRFGSQEKDNSMKRISCLAPISREESQTAITRSSSSLTRRWSSVAVPDHKCQLSDELEHKITMMETSITSSQNRLGMILDSVQADIMQVNKGTKELSLEVESIRQKSIAHQDSLHLLNRAQEETRASLELITSQLQTILQQDKFQEILLAVSKLSGQVDTTYKKQNDELSKCLSRDLQAVMCSLKTLHQKTLTTAAVPSQVTGANCSVQKPGILREAEPPKVSKQTQVVPKIEMGSWTSVKPERTSSPNQSGNLCKNLQQRRTSLVKDKKVYIELDDETDDDLSCLVIEKGSDKHHMNGMEEETLEILRKARRRRRKQDSKRPILAPRK